MAATEPAAAPDPAGSPDTQKPALPQLTEPAGGVPDLVEDPTALHQAAGALREGSGSVAIDAERASGYRYSQRAYLIQVRRAGSGTWLIDPLALDNVDPLVDALRGTEWVLHAATQDLPCLTDLGLVPDLLFDTELGARLAGLPRVGLAAVTEHYLQVSLAKEHSAVDWSTRPLPEPWLRYAALDVELLTALRDALAADLEQQGKSEWARQEFAALTSYTEHRTRPDPWRRTSGMHKVRDRRAAARVRELWLTRDEVARTRDVAPGRVLPDAALLTLAVRAPRSMSAVTDVVDAAPGTRSRSRSRRAHHGLHRHQRQWWEALQRAAGLSDDELPELSRRAGGPPPPRSWPDKDPVAAKRLAHAKETLAALSEKVVVPVENLTTPEAVRRILWTPPVPHSGAGEVSQDQVEAAMADHGARPWQRELVGPLLAAAINEHRSK